MADEEEYTVRLGIGLPGSTSRAEVGDGCYFEATTDPICKVLSAARLVPGYYPTDPVHLKIEINADGTEATCTLKKLPPSPERIEIHDCKVHGHCCCWPEYGCCYCDE